MPATDSTTEYFRNNLLRRSALRVTAVSLVGVLFLTVAAPVVTIAAPKRLTNRDKNVTATEVRQALRNTTGVIEASAQTKVGSDADSALVAETADATIDVAKDAKAGVTIASEDGQSLTVSLPNATGSAVAQQVAPGIVAYPSGNGFANAVQSTQDGSVRMLTVIDNSGAPTRYDYKIFVPDGGQVRLTNDGGAVVLSGNQQVSVVVDKPWAKDANNAPVKTWFTTNGQNLTQHVKHNVAGVMYPITADPRITWSWHGVTARLNRSETNFASRGYNAALSLFGWKGVALGFAIAEAAQWATSRGYCLALYKNHVSIVPVTWLYRC